MLVRVTRSGGFAGMTLTGELNTASLDADRRGIVEQTLAELAHTGRRPVPTQADRFQYDLAVTGDDGTTLRVTLHEPDLDSNVRALLTGILEHSCRRG